MNGEERVVLQTALNDLKDEQILPSETFDDWATSLPVDTEYVGAGDCKHAVFLNDCPECSELMGTPLEPRYVPQGDNALSAQIARQVMGTADWSAALPVDDLDFVLECNEDPDVMEEVGAILKEHEEAFGIQPVDLNVVHMFGGIGMAAEDGVSEAELDGRVQTPDPARTLLRQLMGEIHSIREFLSELDEIVVQTHIRADGLMELADGLLKELLTR